MAAIESLPLDLQRIGRRTTAVLFAGQSLVSAAAIATATVMTIVGEELSGNPAWAGVPFAAVQLAAAPFALVWGVAWDRIGRRNGLTAGLLLGLVGMALG